MAAVLDTKPHRNLGRLAPLAGSRILVVGGCGAIGRPLVDVCRDLELEVAIFALPRSLEAHPPREDVLSIAADAADERSVGDAVLALGRHWDTLDALIFLVGFMTVPPRPIDEMNLSEWESVIGGNLRSAYLVSRAVLPLLRVAGDASIVTVGSSLGYNPLPGVSAYAAAKAGLGALTKSLAIENAPHVRANLVAPSAIDTEFLAGGGRRRAEGTSQSGDEWFRNMSASYVSTIPMKRIALPEDVIAPILFLAGPGSAFITGQVLHVNGGRLTP